MSEEYKISLGAVLDDSALSSLQSQINGMKLEPIKLQINSKAVDDKIANIKQQIQELSEITINLGAGKPIKGNASIKQETAAYKQLLSIASQIDKLTLKTGGMKASGLNLSSIKNAQTELQSLRTEYERLYNDLSNKNLSKADFKIFSSDISKVENGLTKIKALLATTQSELKLDIKSKISDGTLDNQISALENRFKLLGVNSDEVSNRIQKLKSLLSTMGTSDDIDSVVSDYKNFQNTIVKTTNLLENLKRQQKANNDLTKLDQERTSLSSKIDVWMTNNSAAVSQFGAKLEYIKSQIAGADKIKLNGLKAEFQEVTRQAQIAGVATQSMGDKFKAQMSKLGTYFSASMVIMKGIQTVKQMYQNVLEVDTAMTGFYRVTEMTGEQYENMYDQMVNSAQKYGSTLSDIINLTTNWTKLGFDPNVAKSLAEITTMYQHVADVDVNTATQDLIGTYKGFQETLDSVYQGDTQSAVNYIADIYNKLGNEFAVSSANIGDAMQRSASSLQKAGNNIQESAGMATGIIEVVQNAEKAGSTLNVVSLRLRGMKGELEALGEESDEYVESISKMQTHILNLTHGKVNIFQDNGDFKSTYQIFKEISEIYDTLTDTEQADLLETVAGKMRANSVAALISNWSQVEKATKAAYNATGAAAQENESYLESMEGKINTLKASYQALSNTFLSSDFLKNLIDDGNTALTVLDDITKTIGALPVLIGAVSGALSGFKNIGRTKMFVLKQCEYADSNNSSVWIRTV